MQKIILRGLIGVVFALGIVSIGAAQADSGTNAMPWWNDRVFYEIFVRSFQDSDGDGIGDLQGLISKLDYLNDGDPATDTDLGITGLWLMPIMQSPSYHGYDVTDYMTVEADYGINDDFKQLVAEAHKRGIAIIVDMVINHTSREHPWFQEAITPGSQYDQWYRWSNGNPGYLGPWGQRVWHSAGNRYYYGIFWEGMPDLNVRNPAVTQALYSVADFWLNEMGADGFRLDAIKHMVEDGQRQENTEGTFNWLQKWNERINTIKEDAFMVGEIFGGSGNLLSLYVPEKVDVAFDFGFADATLRVANSGASGSIRNVQEQILELYPPGQYAAFLTNHDQNRAMNTLAEAVNQAKVAASILLTNPGVPFIYYGEEIGMIGLKPDECLRTPMQWDAETRPAAFMSGKNCQTNAADFNLAAQIDDPTSLFNHYRTLIQLRNDHVALRTGAYISVESASDNVYSFIRHNAEESILALVNLSGETVTDYGLSLETSALRGVSSASLLLGEGQIAAPELSAEGGFSDFLPLPELAPYSTIIIQFS